MSYLPRSERRRAIIEATLRQVSKVGFGGLTTRGIAQELGAAPGTIHHNFESLTALKCAALQHLGDTALKDTDRMMNELPPEEAFLNALVFSSDPDYPDISQHWISVADEASRSEEIGELYGELLGKMHKQFTDYIEAYARSIELEPATSPNLLAWKLLAMATSLNDFQISGRVPLTGAQVRKIIDDELKISLLS